MKQFTILNDHAISLLVIEYDELTWFCIKMLPVSKRNKITFTIGYSQFFGLGLEQITVAYKLQFQ